MKSSQVTLNLYKFNQLEINRRPKELTENEISEYLEYKLIEYCNRFGMKLKDSSKRACESPNFSIICISSINPTEG